MQFPSKSCRQCLQCCWWGQEEPSGEHLCHPHPAEKAPTSPWAPPESFALDFFEGIGGRNAEKILFILMVRSKARGTAFIPRHAQPQHLRLQLCCLLTHVKKLWGNSRQLQPFLSFPHRAGSDSSQLSRLFQFLKSILSVSYTSFPFIFHQHCERNMKIGFPLQSVAIGNPWLRLQLLN